jgi:uncharacterized protein (TIGR02246 family)
VTIPSGFDDSISAQDRAEIHELISRYCWASDTGDVELLLSLYAPDGSFSGRGGTVNGHKELQFQLEERPPDRYGTQHTVTNIVLWQEDDAIQATSYCLIAGPTDDGSVIRTRGFYRDQIVRVDGHWVFASRTFTQWEVAPPKATRGKADG